VAGLASGLWALIVVPPLVWTAMAALLRVAGRGGPIGATWRRIALPVAVVVAAGHMVKACALAVREARLAQPNGVFDRRLMLPKLALGSALLAILAGWALG
jgi:hypothetical protein